MPVSLKTISLAAGAVALFAVPALAHHSHAMFDDTKKVTMEGTVKAFEWTNPHSWLQVNVTDQAGVTKEWSLEMGSPAGLARSGWRPKTLVAGDKVTVIIHPLKDGNPGGSLLSVKLPDGKVMGDQYE
jgi:hypothetical protein